MRPHHSRSGPQRSLWTRLIDGVRKMIRQQLERSVRIDAEMLCELSDVIVAQRGAELVGRHRQICTAAKPGLHLGPKSALLQLDHDALQIAKVRLGQHRRDEIGHGGRFDLAQRAGEQII